MQNSGYGTGGISTQPTPIHIPVTGLDPLGSKVLSSLESGQVVEATAYRVKQSDGSERTGIRLSGVSLDSPLPDSVRNGESLELQVTVTAERFTFRILAQQSPPRTSEHPFGDIYRALGLNESQIAEIRSAVRAVRELTNAPAAVALPEAIDLGIQRRLSESGNVIEESSFSEGRGLLRAMLEKVLRQSISKTNQATEILNAMVKESLSLENAAQVEDLTQQLKSLSIRFPEFAGGTTFLKQDLKEVRAFLTQLVDRAPAEDEFAKQAQALLRIPGRELVEALVSESGKGTEQALRKILSVSFKLLSGAPSNESRPSGGNAETSETVVALLGKLERKIERTLAYSEGLRLTRGANSVQDTSDSIRSKVARLLRLIQPEKDEKSTEQTFREYVAGQSTFLHKAETQIRQVLSVIQGGSELDVLRTKLTQVVEEHSVSSRVDREFVALSKNLLQSLEIVSRNAKDSALDSRVNDVLRSALGQMQQLFGGSGIEVGEPGFVSQFDLSKLSHPNRNAAKSILIQVQSILHAGSKNEYAILNDVKSFSFEQSGALRGLIGELRELIKLPAPEFPLDKNFRDLAGRLLDKLDHLLKGKAAPGDIKRALQGFVMQLQEQFPGASSISLEKFESEVPALGSQLSEPYRRALTRIAQTLRALSQPNSGVASANDLLQLLEKLRSNGFVDALLQPFEPLLKSASIELSPLIVRQLREALVQLQRSALSPQVLGLENPTGNFQSSLNQFTLELSRYLEAWSAKESIPLDAGSAGAPLLRDARFAKLLLQLRSVDIPSSGSTSADKSFFEFTSQLASDLEALTAQLSPQGETTARRIVANSLSEIIEKYSSTALKSGSGEKGSIGEAVRQFETVLKGQELIRQLNPLMKALGEPALMLFPSILQGFISQLEITLYPPAREVQRDGKRTKSGGGDRFEQLSIRVKLPVLGAVHVDLAHSSSEVMLNIFVQRDSLAKFFESKLPLLETAINRTSYRLSEVTVGVQEFPENHPEWVKELAQGDVIIA